MFWRSRNAFKMCLQQLRYQLEWRGLVVRYRHSLRADAAEIGASETRIGNEIVCTFRGDIEMSHHCPMLIRDRIRQGMKRQKNHVVAWWPGAESNCRHADFQSAALPTELPGQSKRRSVEVLFSRVCVGPKCPADARTAAIKAAPPSLVKMTPRPAARRASPQAGHSPRPARSPDC